MNEYTIHITEWGVELHRKGRVVYTYNGVKTGNHELDTRGVIIDLLAEGIADLERLLRAALAENPTWHSDAAVEAERVLDAAGKGDEPDDPAVIDIPGKGRVRIQTDDTEAERVRRELDRRVEQAEGDDE